MNKTARELLLLRARELQTLCQAMQLAITSGSVSSIGLVLDRITLVVDNVRSLQNAMQ